jgi:hypothetical protein
MYASLPLLLENRETRTIARDMLQLFDPSLHTHLGACLLWLYGLWSFQAGGTKLERFLLKNQHTQRKLLNFEFWINGKLSK